MSIDNMLADLDYLLAERAMGWTEDPEGCWLDKNNKYADTGWGTKDNTYHLPFWQPSTNVATAWIVIQKLKDWEFVLQWNTQGKAAGKWVAYFSKDLFMDDQEGIFAKTAPLAICRAALKAVIQNESP